MYVCMYVCMLGEEVEGEVIEGEFLVMKGGCTQVVCRG